MTAERPRFRTADFAYDLPPELIAQAPPPERGASRLLVVRREASRARVDVPPDSVSDARLDMVLDMLPDARPETALGMSPDARSEGISPDAARDASFRDAMFLDLPSLIPAGDVLVINTTKVRHARLLGTRPSGAPAEVLLVHPGADDTWVALGRPGSALRPGKRIALGDDSAIETVDVLPDGHRLVRFIGTTAEDAIARFGCLPLPPYIDREPTGDDDARYQTVYAEREGSVAAPTAGLHFTPALLATLAANGVTVAGLDLQVGPGTFKPVEAEDPAAHPMHPERYDISPAVAATLATARDRGSKIWAVGTTVVRALESAAAEDGTLRAGRGETTLMITPGYVFRVVDRLLTNFHLPRSTLLMLVSAFAGYDTTMAAYRHAIRHRYRFYSYGDAMLVL